MNDWWQKKGRRIQTYGLPGERSWNWPGTEALCLWCEWSGPTLCLAPMPYLHYDFFPNKANLMNKQLSSLQSLPPPATMSLLYLLQGLKFQNDRHIPLGSESFLVFKQMFLKSVSSYDSIKYPLVMRLRRCRLSNFWTSTMYQALFCALYHVWSQSTLQQKMLRRATKHLAEEDSTEIKTQKGLNCKLGDKGLKNFRHFTIMPWSSPAFYYFFLTSIKCLLLLFPITEGRAEYALHYAGYKKKKKNNPRQWKYVHLA